MPKEIKEEFARQMSIAKLIGLYLLPFVLINAIYFFFLMKEEMDERFSASGFNRADDPIGWVGGAIVLLWVISLVGSIFGLLQRK